MLNFWFLVLRIFFQLMYLRCSIKCKANSAGLLLVSAVAFLARSKNKRKNTQVFAFKQEGLLRYYYRPYGIAKW